jgi:hypothetical protein
VLMHQRDTDSATGQARPHKDPLEFLQFNRQTVFSSFTLARPLLQAE